MNFKLINEPNPNFSVIQQILFNRGIKQEDVERYLNLSERDINSFILLGEQNLKDGLSMLLHIIKQNKNVNK